MSPLRPSTRAASARTSGAPSSSAPKSKSDSPSLAKAYKASTRSSSRGAEASTRVKPLTSPFSSNLSTFGLPKRNMDCSPSSLRAQKPNQTGDLRSRVPRQSQSTTVPILQQDDLCARVGDFSRKRPQAPLPDAANS